MNDAERALALRKIAQRMDPRLFDGLPRPMQDTLGAFAELEERLTRSAEAPLDEDDLFEAILFELESEWSLSEDASLRVAQALDAFLAARDELEP